MTSRQIAKVLFFLLGDILLITASMVAAFLLRFDGRIPVEYQDRLIYYIGLSIGITLPIFLLRGLYSFTWAFVSIYEILEVLKGVMLSVSLFTASFLLLRNSSLFAGFPRSIIILHFGLVFLLVSFLRVTKRLKSVFLNRGAVHSGGGKPAFIIGADELAEQLVRTLLYGKSGYHIVGILDDMPIKQNTFLHGIPVIGRVAELSSLAQRYAVETVIIALPTAKREVVRNVYHLARSAHIKDIKIVPNLLELLSGSQAIQELRQVKVEDLLGREQATIDTSQIEHFIKGRVVLITGAAGSIGSELARQVSKFSPRSLHLLDYDESGLFSLAHGLQSETVSVDLHVYVTDVRNTEKMQMLLEHISPQVVFHAAAYKHVPLMESFPDEAVSTNVFGTLSVFRAALRAGVDKVVLVSTDKAVRPISVMGQTKKIAEMMAQAFNGVSTTKFVSVRFGNVLGSRGSVVPLFEEQLKRGGPLTITDPRMTRFFMTAPEAVLLVMEAGAIGQGGEIFVLDMGEPVKIIDLAKELIRLSGLEPDKDIEITYIGKRPGEKLAEEVLTAEEGTTATRYQKIYRVHTRAPLQLEVLTAQLDELKRKIGAPLDLRSALIQLTSNTKPHGTLSSFAALRTLEEYPGGARSSYS